MTTKRTTKKDAEQSGPASQISTGQSIKNPPPSPEEEKRLRQSNHDCLMRLADKLEAGEPLTSFEPEYAAAALRQVARQVKDGKTIKPKGRPLSLDPGTVAMEFALILRGQMDRDERINQSKAHAALAGKYDVDVRAITRAIAPQKDAACRLARVPLPHRG